MLTDEELAEIESSPSSWDVPALVEALRVERATSKQLREAAVAIIPNVENCLRWLSTENYRTYRDVWDATRTTLTELQRALGDVSAKGAAQ
jgi:hypothetical protein